MYVSFQGRYSSSDIPYINGIASVPITMAVPTAASKYPTALTASPVSRFSIYIPKPANTKASNPKVNSKPIS